MSGPLAAPGLDAHDLAALRVRLRSLAHAALRPARATPPSDSSPGVGWRTIRSTRRDLAHGIALERIGCAPAKGDGTIREERWTLLGDHAHHAVRLVVDGSIETLYGLDPDHDAAFLAALADAARDIRPDPLGTADAELDDVVSAIADRVAELLAGRPGTITPRTTIAVVPPSPFGPGSIVVGDRDGTMPHMIVDCPAWLAALPTRSTIMMEQPDRTTPGTLAAIGIRVRPMPARRTSLARRPAASDPMLALRSHALVPVATGGRARLLDLAATGGAAARRSTP